MQRYGQVLRRPQWILRTALAVLAVGMCFALAFWQYERTQGEIALAEAAVAHLADYEQVLPADRSDETVPAEGLGRYVQVSGVVLPGARSLVRDRTSPGGKTGYLVVDGVELADGRVVAVVQGWVPTAAAASSFAGRRIRTEGRLQPDENFYSTAPVPADGPLLTVTRAGLLAQWESALAGRSLAPGYVVVTGAAADAQLQPVRPVVGSDPDVPYPWQNVFYTVQWLIFAGVVVLIWARWLRDDVREAEGSAPDEAAAAAGDRVSL